MCPFNTEQVTESRLVSSSRLLNLPNGPRLWSCSHTRMSSINNGRPQQQILLIPLPVWMQMFLCLFSTNSVTKEKCPSWIYNGTKQEKDTQGHEIWIEARSSWDEATGLCSYSRGLSVSLMGRHTHSHTLKQCYWQITKRDREVAAVTFRPADVQQQLSPPRGPEAEALSSTTCVL